MPLDENLPTYTFRPSSDNHLHTLLFFTHNGSQPTADYLLKRPSPTESHNQYALGLFDVHLSTVLYAEVLIKPEWSQPTLSAAEVRANGGNAAAVAMTPNSFGVSLYNPEHTVTVKHQNGSWSKDSWEFEIPERSFKLPSASEIDRVEPEIDLVPKVNFRWRRNSRMSRDMTCYMSGRTIGGKKNKEPDITIAMFQGGNKGGTVAIYEPNMRRVEIEDRKGLEVVLLLSAEVIRELYLSPRANSYNTNASSTAHLRTNSNNINQPPKPVQKTVQKQATMPAVVMSGALNSSSSSKQKSSLPSSSQQAADRRKAEVESEKRKVQALVAQEQSKNRERERRDKEEQACIKGMLEREEKDEKKRRQKQVDQETERLRKKYGVQQQQQRQETATPVLPPRPGPSHPTRKSSSQIPMVSGALNGPLQVPQQPPRPQSVGPSQCGQNHNQGQGHGGARQKLGQLLHNNPYAGPAAATVSGFFGKVIGEEDKRKAAGKKRSTLF